MNKEKTKEKILAAIRTIIRAARELADAEQILLNEEEKPARKKRHTKNVE